MSKVDLNTALRLAEALEEMMRWQVRNVNCWNNSAYDNAHRVLEQFRNDYVVVKMKVCE